MIPDRVASVRHRWRADRRLRALHAPTSLTPHLTRHHTRRPRMGRRSTRSIRSYPMRRAVTVAMLTLGIGCAAPPRTVPAPAAVAPALGAVTAEELRRDLYAFADDSMHGRETGTDDVTRAMRFLVARLTQLGLEPAGDSGFAQRVPMQKEVFGKGTRIAVEEAGSVREVKVGT